MTTNSKPAAPFGPPPTSDRRLKTDIVRLGSLRDDIPLYRFRYVDGTETFVGVMAQDVLPVMPEAVIVGDDGYMRVDYARLGTRMVSWEEWQAIRGGSRSPAAVRDRRVAAPMGPPPVSDRRLKTDIVMVGSLRDLIGR